MWQENDFGENLPVNFADTVRVKNFDEIALALTVCGINTYWHFTQKSKLAAKSGGETIFAKLASRLCIYPAGQKIRRNHSSLLRFRDKHVFAFYAEIQDGPNIGGKMILRKLASRLRRYPVGQNFVEITLALIVSEINMFLRFMPKFRMAAQSGGKPVLAKTCQKILQIPYRSKILSKSLWLSSFPR